MNTNKVLEAIRWLAILDKDKDMQVTYDVGGKGQPHRVSQHGVLRYYLDDPESTAEKICLVVPSKIRDGAEKDKVPYTSCSILHCDDIVSIKPYVKPEKATA
jgi:hypothetical protein